MNENGSRSTMRCATFVVVASCIVLQLLCSSVAMAAEPAIGEESTTEVGSTAATLHARINPSGVSTSAYFQYSTTSTASCTPVACPSAPASPDQIGSGTEEVEVPGQIVQGLAPGTLYHYRVVARSRIEVAPGEVKTEEFFGPDETFTTQIGGGLPLPDGRQWEMVSPHEKLGARIASVSETAFGGTLTQAAADGDAVAYLAYAPTELDPVGNPGVMQVFSGRGPDGWRSWDLATPHETPTGASVGPGNEFRFFSEDLSQSILQPFGSFIAATPQEEAEPLAVTDRALAPVEASEQTAFLRTDYLNGDPGMRCERPSASCYRPLVTAKPPYNDVPIGTEFGEKSCHEIYCGPEFLAATPDLAHILLRMTPNPGQAGIYEWSAGALRLVTTSGELLQTIRAEDTRHIISNDGSRVFFHEPGGTDGFGSLWMTEPLRGTAEQLDLAEPGCGGCESGGAVFQYASSDGTRVFFTDYHRLTKDSGASAIKNPETRDLYECRIVEEAGGPKCVLSDLTPRNAEGESGVAQGKVIGASEDGAWLYFVADGVLENHGKPVPGAVHGTCGHEQKLTNSCNLYVRHEGETQLVAVVSEADVPDWGGGVGSDVSGIEDMVSRVSPNGHWLAFMSLRELTGYDNRDAASRQHDEEVYLYDATARKLTCASCDPTGARPRGDRYDSEGSTEEPSMPLVSQGIWRPEVWLAASLPTWTMFRHDATPHQPRFLADSGRLFFDSASALVPQDANNNWDVYEYEPPGVGECTGSSVTFNERSGGCVGLISSGTFAGESAFMDASANGGREAEGNEGGRDVFFITAAQLTAQDKDHALDVYDAHECSTVSPCPPPAAEQPLPCASAEACRPASASEPEAFGVPASASSPGTGNVVTAPPVKGTPKTAAQIKAERLAKALRACRADKNRKKRKACEALARRRYGSAHKASRRKVGSGASSGSRKP